MLDQGVAQSTELVFKDDDSVYKLAEKHERLLLIYEEIVYDVTEFSDRHPGNQ
jgi:cytochrome b involved in lipid metabolism